MLFLRSFFCLCWFINCVNVFILNFLGRSRSSDAENPGNNLYVTGLSPRITKRELEKHFAAEGKVSILFIVFLFHYTKGWWVKSWFNAMWEWFLCAVFVFRWLMFTLWSIRGQESLVVLGLLRWPQLRRLTVASSIWIVLFLRVASLLWRG